MSDSLLFNDKIPSPKVLCCFTGIHFWQWTNQKFYICNTEHSNKIIFTTLLLMLTTETMLHSNIAFYVPCCIWEIKSDFSTNTNLLTTDEEYTQCFSACPSTMPTASETCCRRLWTTIFLEHVQRNCAWPWTWWCCLPSQRYVGADRFYSAALGIPTTNGEHHCSSQ